MNKIHVLDRGNYSKCGYYLGATKSGTQVLFKATCPTCKLIVLNELTSNKLTPYNQSIDAFKPNLGKNKNEFKISN